MRHPVRVSHQSRAKNVIFARAALPEAARLLLLPQNQGGITDKIISNQRAN